MTPSKLGLGTAQFGLDYGIANTAGKTPAEEVARILDESERAGVRLVDTASLYGDSEETLGRCMPAAHKFLIVTKTPKFQDGFGAGEARLVEDTLVASLHKLRVPRVHALLAHEAGDLLGPDGSRFFDALLAQKDAGRVAKVGASVYTPAQVDALLARWKLDVIQVPFNVLDQRLSRGGQLAALRAAGVEVHARSIFLQGILLMDSARLPAFLAPAQPLLQKLSAEVATLGLTPLQAALAFVLQRPEISYGLVGVCNHAQLLEILAATPPPWTRLPDWSTFHCAEESVVNPSLWPRRQDPQGESRC